MITVANKLLSVVQVAVCCASCCLLCLTQDADPHLWRHLDALWLHPKLQEDATHPGGWSVWHIVSVVFLRIQTVVFKLLTYVMRFLIDCIARSWLHIPATGAR
jgi:hypothetical protein